MYDISPNNYLDFIRKQKYCCTCLKNVKIEPSHIEAIGMGRNRKLELLEHYTAIPQCRMCHSEYHALGLNQYQKKHHINLYQVCLYYVTSYLYKETGVGILYGKHKSIIESAEA